MAVKIFDKETLLDLTVNIIPLFIIGFFLGLFLLYQAWGWNTLPSVLMIGLHVVPFVALALLTYLSGKAIAGSEKTDDVFHQGQALVPGVGDEEGDEALLEAETGATAGAETEAASDDGETDEAETAETEAAESGVDDAEAESAENRPAE
ncbi:DUF6684 family protein [Halegenticoccus tardaugens]|uniref:DUF6684 family protein n=1 Tax=Halegenticoccus tardaugens TaxID=2071624 RepID=UPI001E4EDFD8|nr:DUF6684 family protein [Halegenticoccus tardaugens]